MDMANFMYTNAKKLMLTGEFDWVNDNVVVILIADGLYTPSVNHETLLDVPAAARVAVSTVLTGKTVVKNVVDADDYLFTSVSGPAVNAVIFAVASGTESSSPLICYMDTAVVGIPFSPSTASVRIVWNNGADKIFSL